MDSSSAGFIFIALLIVIFLLWNSRRKKKKALKKSLIEQEKMTGELEAAKSEKDTLQNEVTKLRALEKYQQIDDAKNYAENEIEKADRQAKLTIDTAEARAISLVSQAEEKAREIAGRAYELQGRENELSKTIQALKNVIDGYGDEYIIPSRTVLDDLADEFGYEEAGREQKVAKAKTKLMIKSGEAALCDYVEQNRKETAIAFVVDAFNGKVDSILSDVKHNNYGKMKSAIEDAYAIVNNNGKAFRNARITPRYLENRLQELFWGVALRELKLKQQEEQREIRDRMREEEKAKRDYERAIKEAKKEEETLQKAMDKARSEYEKATEEKKAEWESKIIDLQARLIEAESKNIRAVSMAQLTRSGNVYVISNIGAFGENVYKIGMTRRLEPLDRVRELGDASVPFPFDVHAILYSDDAPVLEADLHKAFLHAQMNKVNPRKEFFKTSIDEIKHIVESKGIRSAWTMAADAAQYKETLAIEQSIASNPSIRAEWERHMMREIEEDESIELEEAN